MKFPKLIAATLISALFFVSCNPNEDVPKYVPLGSYDSGVLVLNQGGFNGNNASVSYVSFDLNSMQNNIYGLVNPTKTLGDTGQDIGFNSGLAYIVLNGSNKIEIVNRYTMASVGTVTSGLSNPRCIAFANGKAYVTNWGTGTSTTDDYVAVIDLATKTVSSTIPVAEGPEKIIENNGKLYVAHQGGYNYGSTVSVINANTNTVTATIAVGDVPNTLQIDNGSLWVSCSGNPIYAPIETGGKILKINLATNAVEKTISYSNSGKHISNFAISGTNAYYTINSDVYKMALEASAFPATPAFTSTATNLYSFAIKNNHLYIGDAGDYSSNGKVYIYSLGTAIGSGTIGILEKTHTVGILPAGFYFNQ